MANSAMSARKAGQARVSSSRQVAATARESKGPRTSSSRLPRQRVAYGSRVKNV